MDTEGKDNLVSVYAVRTLSSGLVLPSCGQESQSTPSCSVRQIPFFFFFFLTFYFVLEYSWLVPTKNLPAMQETRVHSLGLENPLEKGMETDSSILAWRIPMDKGAWQATVHRVTKSRT